MARPAKATVDYFPHTATPGKTLFILEQRWGNNGYAAWFKLLELLCQTEGHVYDAGNSVNRAFLAAKLGIDEFLLTEILDLLADMGKIDKNLWISGLIWCQSLVDNVKDAYKRRMESFPTKPVSVVENDKNEDLAGFPSAEIPENSENDDRNRERERERERKGKGKESTSQSKNKFSDEHLSLATMLMAKIRNNKPDFVGPNKLDAWANDARLMMERDGRSYQQIQAVIVWCQQDSFWRSNVLSMKTLREKFDRLEMQMNRPGGGPSGGRGGQRTASDMAAEAIRRAEQLGHGGI